MVDGTRGISKGSPRNHGETTGLQIQLWGDSDNKGYPEKEVPREGMREEQYL